MSTNLVLSELDRFLRSSEPGVICLRGKWGAGKTYAWQNRVAAGETDRLLPLPGYSYVSLFGINSLNELKFAIFEYSRAIDQNSAKPTLHALDASLSKAVPWRKVIKHASRLPIVGQYLGSDAVAFASFLSIKKQIVCFDDIERRGKDLEINDVLGLASFLREQRHCKVALILNDGKLDEGSRRAFDQHLEKVVDVSLVYQPTAPELAAIAVKDSDPIAMQVREKCIALSVSNIRVVRRALHFVKMIKPLLERFDEEVLKSAISSLVLFSWSHDQPDEAPPLDYLKRVTEFSRLTPKKDQSAQQVSWNALLDAYGYAMADELDLALMDGVCDGYFDPDRISKGAAISHEQALANKADGSFSSAWRLYHDTFRDNTSEVTNAIYRSFMRDFKYVSPLNLDGTISLFKDLGKRDQALEMLNFYVANRQEDRKFFDLSQSPFGGEIKDPDVRAAFASKASQMEEKRDIPAIIMSIQNGWDDDRLATLAALPAEEYKKLFERFTGIELRQMLANLLQFDRIVNASQHMQEISRRTRDALRQIGREAPINARRVRRFGIELQEDNGAGRTDSKKE